ncbi:MAG: hypothetical protein WCP73_07115, partial [Eubacteriales bacterium]
SLIARYGVLDGQMSALYAERFTEVSKTLTDSQRAALVKLRDLNVVPKGAYCFASEVAMPAVPNTDYLFGAGSAPADEGQLAAPSGFSQNAGPGKQE